jgi:hypothetical protein
MEDALQELINNTKRRDYDEYLKDEFRTEKQQVQRGIMLEREIVAAFEEYVRTKGATIGLELRTVTDEAIDNARRSLYGGQVVAVDGRREKPLDIISGVFCEVGLASVSYQTMSNPEVRCLSITSHIEESTTKEEYYENSSKGKVNENEVTNAMIFWELETCIELAKTAKYVFKDGPVLHPGLVWKDQQFTFDLLERAIAAKNIVGIVKDFRAEQSAALWRYGRCLKPRQYLIVYRGVENWIKSIGKEGELTEKFKQGAGKDMVRGVFKASRSFWAFEAHKDTVHEAIPVVMADALNNKRGIPQLVDLADQILRKRFPSGLYADKINREFLHHGMEYYLDIVDERMLRY